MGKAKRKNKAFSPCGFVSVPAKRSFPVSDYFVENTTNKRTVRLFSIGEDFKVGYLGKVEERLPATALKVQYTRKRMNGAEIITELGGEPCAETSLWAIWSLLRKQRQGQPGILTTDTFGNYFFVRDVSGVLQSVIVRFLSGSGWENGGGWQINAVPLSTRPTKLSGEKFTVSVIRCDEDDLVFSPGLEILT